MTSGTKPNRLIREKSPYLLQHAMNPVDWYPWGEEAFEKARREQKPVFLSIGYSTCHWCHVMEEESFSDPAVAQILNSAFVPVKVDREERPDVDHVYMDAVMAMTGSGGWPLNLFLTPELKPFYGGTYFPPRDAYGRPGFGTILLALEEKWKTEREGIENAGQGLVQALQAHAAGEGAERQALAPGLLDRAAGEMQERFDDENGGFGEAPKFPSSHGLSFLLYYGKNTGQTVPLRMVERTLAAMARGGIWDALGGGFHRYSTDERWHVPHFEKMLYDQALLSRTYTEAFQVTSKPLYRDVAMKIFDYVLRDLRSPEGGFYSAEDADSVPGVEPGRSSQSRPDGDRGSLPAADATKKVEGAFYAWKAAELSSLLTEEEMNLFAAAYGVEDKGNVSHDPFGEFAGKNVLYQSALEEGLAQDTGKTREEVKEILERASAKLFAARAKRPRPHLDDKILMDWNGLMAAGFAYAARVFKDSRLEKAARESVDFIRTRLRQKDGRYLHRWREGEAAVPAFLDDYAFFIHALYELYETTFDAAYLKEALHVAEDMIRLFVDPDKGGFFFTGRDAEPLFSRPKPAYDGAIPSGNSMAIWVLARLGNLTLRQDLRDAASKALEALSWQISARPSVYPVSLCGLDILMGNAEEIVIASSSEEEARAWADEAAKILAPGRAIALSTGEKNAGECIPFLQQQVPLQGKTTAYFCRNGACRQPVQSRDEFLKLLQEPR